MRSQTKIAILIGLVCTTLVVLFGVAIYYFQNKYSYQDFYKRLEARAGIEARFNFAPDTLNTEALRTLRNEHLERLDNEMEYIIPVSESNNIAAVAKQYKLPKALVKELVTNNFVNYKDGHTLYAGKAFTYPSGSYYVIVSAEHYYSSHHLMFLRNLIIGGILLTVLIMFLLSIYFSRHIFVPIQEITAKVKEISSENMHLRLEAAKGNNSNEINELINTFNDLLSRIETAFETQKNFISNASHELGTPLTAIIGEADVALMKQRSPLEYETAIQHILQQAERLDQITKSLLFLAQTGYRDKGSNFEMVRLDEVLWQTHDIINKLIPQNKIQIDLSLLPEDPRKLKVFGNKQLLQMAIANILNNACKYSGNLPVEVFIASSDKHIILTIQDHGIGIPDSEMPFIYDPFFRASNTKLFEGYGIGLPLTRNVVKLHKGELVVTSKVGSGTTVTIKLPLLMPDLKS